MKLYIIASIILLFISGCSTAQPAITEYRISTNPVVHKSYAQGCKENSLKVAKAFSSSSLMSLDMDYGIGINKQFTYSQSQYSTSPNDIVTTQILKLLREMQIFKTIQISKSRSKNDYILETTIDDFMQYFSDDQKSSYANVVITFSLINSENSNSIATKTFNSRVDSKSLDAEGGVEALRVALQEVLSDSSVWFGEACR